MKKEVVRLVCLVLIISIFSIYNSNDVNAACSSDSDCSYGNVCINPGSSGYCQSCQSCFDGSVQCKSSTVIEVCDTILNTNGCTEWLFASYCESGTICSSGSCQNCRECGDERSSPVSCSGLDALNCVGLDNGCTKFQVAESCSDDDSCTTDSCLSGVCSNDPILCFGETPICDNGACVCQEGQIKVNTQCNVCHNGIFGYAEDSLCDDNNVCTEDLCDGSQCSYYDKRNDPEICDGADNNCNGISDENIVRACYTGSLDTRNRGICRDGTQTCSAGSFLYSCTGQVLPQTELCYNGLDDDCDGKIDKVDEDCQCDLGAVSMDGTLCVGGSCTGTPSIDCYQFKDLEYCRSRPGCEWKKQLSESYKCVVTSCNGLNRDKCNKISGCSYISGASDLCEQDENIKVNAGYSGLYCPQVDKLQIDAQDSSGSCDIQFTGGDISGITLSTMLSTSGNINTNWKIPSVPVACCGRTVTPRAAAFWDGEVGSEFRPDGADSLSGSFTFAGGLTSGCTSDAECCSGLYCIDGACGCPDGFTWDLDAQTCVVAFAFAACYKGTVGNSTGEPGQSCLARWRDPYTSATSFYGQNQPYWKDAIDSDEPDCFRIGNTQSCCYLTNFSNKEYGEFSNIIVKTI